MENGEEVLVNLSRDAVVIGGKEYISFPAASRATGIDIKTLNNYTLYGGAKAGKLDFVTVLGHKYLCLEDLAEYRKRLRKYRRRNVEWLEKEN